jgi:hypothetical protein
MNYPVIAPLSIAAAAQALNERALACILLSL